MPRQSNNFILTAIFVFLFTASTGFAQQVTVESMKSLLESNAGFTAEDFEAVDAGKIAVKRIPGKDSSEMAVCGLVRLALPFDVVMVGFQQTINKQRKETAKDFGRFSNPPTLKDLDGLEFDDGDIETLKNCRVGNCSWHLPREFIEKLQSEIDWQSPEHKAQASELIKKMLVEYLVRYLREGDPALIEYNDRPQTTSLKDEYKKLDRAQFWADTYAPKFSGYLNDFPTTGLAKVENTVSWAKVTMGLKQVLFLTHNSNFQKEQDGVSQGLISSKQIYANHYFDSTLGLTSIVSFPKKNGKHETYVIFVNHSRSRALSGRIGKLVQGLVGGQAIDMVSDVLADTKRNSARVMVNRSPQTTVQEDGFFTKLVKNPYFLWVAVLVVIAILVAGYIRWRSR